MTRPLRAVLVAAAVAVTAWCGATAAAGDAAPPTPAAEQPGVEGAANPADAPLLAPGSYADTILQPETLWYAVDAAAGQRVGATVIVRGRPDGPTSDTTAVEVTVTDPQRQPLATRSAPFTGAADAVVELPSQPLPDLVVADDARPLLGVTLRSSDATIPLADTGYRLELAVVVEGTAVAVDPPPPPAGDPAVPEPAPTVTAAPAPPPAAPAVARDVAPFALVALAVGGVAGFELSRRRF